MAEIVNLRALRKRKARTEAARWAAENRARSHLREARFHPPQRQRRCCGGRVGARSKVGRPKAERELARREAGRAERALDGLRLKREEG